MKKYTITAIILLLLSSTTVLAGQRSAGFHGMGPRVGLTFNPDQFHFGGHIDFGDLAPNLMMMANLEIGVGDNFTTVAPSFEVDYRFHEDWGVWTPYLGGGIGPIFYSWDHNHNSSDLAAYMQFGIGKGSAGNQSGHFFIEAKLGLGDAPDMKTTVGWTFGN